MNVLYVFLGGGIGAVMRFGLSYLILKFPKSIFPIATLSANLIASFLLGVFIAILLKMKSPQADSFQAFWIIGICGGFSTFSTFAKENLELMEKGHWIIAVLNMLISVAFCITMVYLGRKIVI